MHNGSISCNVLRVVAVANDQSLNITKIMEFKTLLIEKENLEELKRRNQITEFGEDLLTELTQALQLLQPDVIKSVCDNKCFCQDNENYNRLICPKCFPNG
jgi:hypothetical protein